MDIDLECEPPIPAQIGDTWICPGCAIKWFYVLYNIPEENISIEAWMTTEIG
jgi:hypothetical protein